MPAELRTYVVGPIQTNCYVFTDSCESIVIDPGSQGGEIARRLAGDNVTHIVATHCHGDHIGGVAALKRATGAPFAIGANDAEAAQKDIVGAFIPGVDEAAPVPDVLLREGDVITVGSTTFTVYEAPGHTPGGIILLAEASEATGGVPCAFVGDTLFRGSCGRCDLEGGDWATMRKTLARLKEIIPADAEVYPGHGMPTVMGVELQVNPYLAD